ncbi:hypothetical protein SFRURICE_013223 [Spodoptera frugiperda]|nr:hypothetical protein SFRURICE_013223 [Spodoptera frugiperda]
MDCKAGFLVFITLLIGSLALPTPEDDMSIFFDHTDASARIVGGNEAAIGSHPHMVGLSSGVLIRSNFCGGSLISQRTILTAAHCIRHVYSFGSLTSGGTAYTISRNVTHPHYVHSLIKNDLGVLITSTDVVLNNLVQVVPITYDFIGQGVQARVAGWGNIRAGGPSSAALLELTTTTIDGNECVARAAQARVELNMMHAPHVEPHIEVCTYHSPGRGTCNGDSGSALRRVDNGQQFGIVSWGFPCALGAPDMFVRLTLPTPEDDMSIFFDHTDASARIVGGNEAAIGSHPHMVALFVGVNVKNFICGGSLITQRSVLTAAHCVDNVYGINSLIRSAGVAVGSTRWDRGDDYALLRNVTHPGYDRWTVKNDICVLITSTDVVLSSLANAYTMSEILLELSMTTIGSEDCVARVSEAATQVGYPLFTDPGIEVCTLHSPGFGVCNGDSGSALRRVDNGQQFGIVSWGFLCARGHPDVFVRISAYESWLKSASREN